MVTHEGLENVTEKSFVHAAFLDPLLRVCDLNRSALFLQADAAHCFRP